MPSLPQAQLKRFMDPRVLAVFWLGLSSGFPWVIIGTGLTLWLQQHGLSRTTIGYFGAVFAAYSVNFLWSPLVDRLRWPWLGNRKGWILLGQLVIVAGCWSMSGQSPAQSLELLAWCAIAVAVAAATHDIAIDAYRIDSFADHENEALTAASSAATAGWWTGYAALGFVPLWLSDLGWTWPELYRVMALMMCVIALGALLVPAPKAGRSVASAPLADQYRRQLARLSQARLQGLMLIALAALGALIAGAWLGQMLWTSLAIACAILLAVLLMRPLPQTTLVPAPVSPTHRLAAWVMLALVGPFHEFFQRNGVRLALSLLLFIFLFKIGEAFLGRMSVVFYKELGFTNTEIATYSKLMSWWVTIVFSLLGGFFTMLFGVVRGLLVGGIAMAASNLLFSLMAVVGPNVPLYAFTVLVDGFCQAWSTVAFVAFLSALANRAFSATQYALMASLGTFARTLLSAYSGVLVDWLDGNWAVFFALTTVMVVPSLLLLWRMRERLEQVFRG